MNIDIGTLNASIEEYQSQLDEEQRKLNESQSGKKEKLLAELKQKEDEHAAAETREDELRAFVDSYSAEHKMKKEAVDQARRRDNDLRDEIEGYASSIANLQQIARGEAGKYGRNLERLFHLIDNHRWKGKKPVGPLGNFVRLRDQKWKSLLQIVIGWHMTSFVTENSADRQALIGMLRQTNK